MRKIIQNIPIRSVKGYAIATLVLIFSLFATIFFFAANNSDNATQIAKQLAAEQGKQKATYIEVTLDSYAEFLDVSAITLGEIISNEVGGFDGEVAADYMKSLRNNHNIRNVAIVSREGVGRNANGQVYNVKNRDYYIKGIHGQSGYTWVFGSKNADETMLVYYTPVTYEIAGVPGSAVLVGYFAKDKLEELLKTEVGGFEAPTFLCVEEGKILGASGFGFNSTQLKEFYTYSKSFKSEDFQKGAEKAFKERNQFVFEYKKGSRTGCGTITPFENYDMVIFQVLDSNTSTDLLQNITNSGRMLILSFILIFVIFGTFISIKALKSRDAIVKAARNARYVARAIEESMYCFYLLDFKKGEYEYIQGKNIITESLGDKGSLAKVTRFFENEIESEEIKKTLKETFAKGIIEEEENLKVCYKSTDSEPRWENLSFVVVEKENEHPTKVLAVVQDATIFKNQEEESLFRQRLVQRLAEDFTTIFTYNANTRKINLIRTVDGLSDGLMDSITLDTDEGSVFHKYVSEKVNEDYREGFALCINKEYMTEKMRKQGKYFYNYKVDLDGEEKYYQLKVTTIPNTEDWLIGFADVDEVMRGEIQQRELLKGALVEAENASKAKSQFLSSMSHDIRTPMNAIIGFTTLAQSHFADTNLVKEYLDKILTSSKHLLGLINDILDMSRIESGKVSLDLASHKVSDIMNEVETLFSEQAVSKSIELTMETEIEHDFVYCDKLRLNQVLINIVGNSMKFTPEGGKISVSLHENSSELRGFNIYEFKISDTGIGMSPEFLKNIWTPFERERTSTVSGIVGTGLGMSITKSIIELMQGDIRVESEVGKGSTFYVSVSLKQAEQQVSEEVLKSEESKEVGTEEMSAAELLAHAKETFSSGKRVLLVEDNEINREIALALLEDAGIETDYAEDGKYALEKLEEAPSDAYDLILMDIQMPIMNGYDTSVAIRKLEDKTNATIPIIAMTANAFDEDVRKALESHMNGHLAKPINVRLLYEILKKVFATEKDTIARKRVAGEDWAIE